jgi:hypothetical protein
MNMRCAHLVVVLLLDSFAQHGNAATVASIGDLRRCLPPASEATTITADAHSYPGDGGGGRFQWDSQCDAEDDGGSIVRPSEVTSGAWVRLRTAKFVHAREYGCRADHEMIRGDLTAEGLLAARTLSGRTRPFSQMDVGKIVIVQAARSWPEYSTDPVPLNARILQVDANGIATLENLDGPERGSLLASRDAAIECFTDNTDAIARALDYQAAHGLSHVQLPSDGVIGLCPFASKTWGDRPTLDTALNTKAVFVLRNGAVLKGAGAKNTQLKVGYFGEFEPFKREGVVPFHHTCILFLLQPVENRRTTCGIEALSVKFPYSPAVMSGYTLVADGWNTSPARNAIHATFRDLAVINAERNVAMVNSIHGGIYDMDNRVIDETVYRFENCSFETGGGFSFKNQNDLRPDQKGGKRVHLTDVQIHGGGNIITRHVPDSASFGRDGDAYYLEVDQPGFTWKNFNAHSNQVAGAFNPICMVRKAYSGTISEILAQPDGSYAITIDSTAGPSPVSKTGATVLIAFGDEEKQVYVEDAATLKEGSNVAICRLNFTGLSPDSATDLIGLPIRIYYDENELVSLYEFDTPRRMRIDPQSAAGQSLLDQRGLDLTVNFSESQGAFGHSFYVGDNVSFFLDRVTIRECAKRSFRVSKGGSEAMQGDHELIDYQVIPSRGMAAMANRRAVHQPMEEFGGRLKLRRSKAVSVYGVELDMDDNSTFESQGGVLGGSAVRNSILRGWVVGSATSQPTLVENSDVEITLCRQGETGDHANRDELDARTPFVTLKNCRGSLGIQNGDVTVRSSQLRFGFAGSGREFNLWRGGIRGTFEDCTFTEQAFGLHEPFKDQQHDFLGRFRFTNCDGIPLVPR